MMFSVTSNSKISLKEKNGVASEMPVLRAKRTGSCKISHPHANGSVSRRVSAKIIPRRAGVVPRLRWAQ